jgi:SEC-C motif-containing protein
MSRSFEVKNGSPCPCSSGKTYRDCCAPYHTASREPETAEALMRSRYSAFAAGKIDHLIRTLHPDHADRRMPPEVLGETLRATVRAYRYTGLVIEDDQESGETATVTFFAKVFERGADRSFRERSTFARTAEGWRYLSGETLSR